MPKIPTYDSPQVAQRPAGGRVNVNANASSFGAPEARARGLQAQVMGQHAQALGNKARAVGQMGAAFETVSDAVDSIVQREQAKSDEISLLEWETKVSEFRTGLYAPDGPMHRKGREAVGLTEHIDQSWAELQAQFPESPRVRARAMRIWMQSRESSMINASRLEVSEKDKYLAQVRASALARTTRHFALAPVSEDGTFETIDVTDEQTNASVHAAAMAANEHGSGWAGTKEGQEYAAGIANKAMSSGIVAKIDSLLARDDPQLALKVFENYKGVMTVSHINRVEGALREAARVAAGRDVGMQIASEHENYGDKVSALNEWIEKNDPSFDEAEVARDWIRQDHFDGERVREESREAVKNDVWGRSADPDAAPLTTEERAILGTSAVTWESIRSRASDGWVDNSSRAALDSIIRMSNRELGEFGVDGFWKTYRNSLSQADFTQYIGQIQRLQDENDEALLWNRTGNPDYVLSEHDKLVLGPDTKTWLQRQRDGQPLHPTQSKAWAIDESQRMIKDGTIGDMSVAEFNDQFLGDLSYQDYREAMAVRNGLRDIAKAPDPLKNTVPSSFRGEIDKHARQVLGIKPYDSLGELGRTNMERHRGVVEELYDKVIFWQEANGRQIDEKSLRELIAHDAMTRVSVDEGFFGGDRSGLDIANMEADAIDRVYLDEVPPSVVESINMRVAQNGQMPLGRGELQHMAALLTAFKSIPQNAKQSGALDTAIVKFLSRTGYDDKDRDWLRQNAPEALETLEALGAEDQGEIVIAR